MNIFTGHLGPVTSGRFTPDGEISNIQTHRHITFIADAPPTSILRETSVFSLLGTRVLPHHRHPPQPPIPDPKDNPLLVLVS